MRIRIIFFPAALAASVTIFIMYVWPAFQELRSAHSGLAESQRVLRETQEKKNNINELKKVLDQNPAKESYVKSFLPVKRGEEEILNGLNFMATSAGVAIFNVALDKDKESPNLKNKTDQEGQTSKDIIFGTQGELGGETAQEIKPLITEKKMQIGVAGGYENMKNFLDQLYRLEMANATESWTLSRAENESEYAESETEAPPPPADLLSLSVDIGFNELGQYQVGNNYASSIFSQKSFDFSIYDKLESLTAKRIPALEASGIERANPFLP